MHSGNMVVVAFSSLVRVLGEYSTSYSPPALLFPFWVEISSSTVIPLFRPGSVHSGLASWDDCNGVTVVVSGDTPFAQIYSVLWNYALLLLQFTFRSLWLWCIVHATTTDVTCYFPVWTYINQCPSVILFKTFCGGLRLGVWGTRMGANGVSWWAGVFEIT